ncbi:MAG TPA: hypothetical protein VM146_12320 [Steroidobacteraceae bacterium]|nr:hypothetical protein [Steroidobacteraceae bacterium]
MAGIQKLYGGNNREWRSDDSRCARDCAEERSVLDVQSILRVVHGE